MENEILSEEIQSLIEKKQYDDLQDKLVHLKAPDISSIIMEQPLNEDLLTLFRLLPKNIASQVFSELDTRTQEYILSNSSDDQIKIIMLGLDVDDRTTLFEDIQNYDTRKLLDLLPNKEREETIALLDYPESSVGRLMNTNFIAVRASWTIDKCLDFIRADVNKNKHSDIIYVTDDHDRLVDYVEISEFIFSDGGNPVIELMDYNIVKLSPFDDREKAIELINHYHLIAVPVTDAHNILIGTVTFDDVMDVYQEEVTEDFHKTSAIQPLETSYISTRAISLFSKRTPWLLILVLVNIASGAVISSFEGIIAQTTALIAFLPLLIASAGNAGSQSSTLVIRAMAMNELSTKEDTIKLILKDICVSVLLGICLAIGVFGLGLLKSGMSAHFADGWLQSGMKFGLVISFSMFCLVIMGDLLGTLLPFVLRLFKVDPALGSSPLVTSLADIIGGLIYFSLATAILIR